jgi:photosystem II stability/assembly factor-like uncharacterized protein
MTMTYRLRITDLLFVLLACLTSTVVAQKIHPDHLKNIKIRNIGPGAMSGRITAIACHPTNADIIYAGAASGGVWRSTNGGVKWEPVFDKMPNQSIGALAINPRNPDEIWAGTGEGNPRNSQNFGVGLYKTLDGGKNWMFVGLEKSKAIHRIIIHRDNPNIIWVGAIGSAYGPNEDRGVFKTNDGGKTWTKTLYVNDLTGCADLVVDPSNPNKLFAAMWEYQRWPWTFKSGGKGSGMYVSHDGGSTWERRTDKDGLPEGELGRMGIAIAASRPEIVYALVEAKANALYKSTDGGKNWRKAAEKNMGDRPFYYAELYVNPKNENMVYSVHSILTRSIDGGRTFDNFVGYNDIHPDHHAFWINPENPDHIINGNDGGIAITRDGGKTWRYAGNIPVGQFYHINIDNEQPYNIYGGLQDNGSWVGPSATWKSGGMRNSEWQEIYFGDGFDVMPQAGNARYCFAMSQGGELAHIDRQTGETRYIKPLHPDMKPLRWNWNAALAQNPFNEKGIFFCSQYVHYSSDLGQNWEIISPDLTTADTSKMHPERSGGLTLDATNAENHCTIIAVAPSPIAEGVIWVGTDDGNLQLTRDGGQNWENLTSKLPGAPKNAWIPQIEVSRHNAGEAFVVLNQYRQNDWQPYVYRTTDFGKTWQRIADSKQVNSFCLSIIQDLEVPQLLFLGTDQGLYYSTNTGATWTHWSNETFPSVPIYDMKIHPRESDLVLATFGRGIWIMDNIRPLREAAKSNLADMPFKVMAAQDGILANFRSYDGPRFAADGEYLGDNKSPNVRIPVWVSPKTLADMKKGKKDEKKDETKPATGPPAGGGGGGGGRGRFGGMAASDPKKEKATVYIFDMQNDTIRRFKADVDSCFNYISWGMDMRGVRFPSNDEPNAEQLEPGGGPTVLPGKYKVLITMGKYKDSTMVQVIDDPRSPISLTDRKGRMDAQKSMQKTVERAEKAYNRLKEAEKTIKLVDDQLSVTQDTTKKAVLKLGSTLRDSINNLKEAFFQQKEGKGIQRGADGLNTRFFRSYSYLNGVRGALNTTQQVAIKQMEMETEAVISRINTLFDKPWTDYRAKVEGVKYSLFKEFGKL